MYSEQTVIDRIEVLEDGQIQIRKAIRVLKDGIKISETYHRHCITPLDDLSQEDAKVQAVAGAVHTQSVKDAFKANLLASKQINE